MSVLFDTIDWFFSFALMVLAVWGLIVITPVINEMRKASQDEDITESWKDVRVSIYFVWQGTKERIINKLGRTR